MRALRKSCSVDACPRARAPPGRAGLAASLDHKYAPEALQMQPVRALRAPWRRARRLAADSRDFCRPPAQARSGDAFTVDDETEEATNTPASRAKHSGGRQKVRAYGHNAESLRRGP